MFKLLLFLFFIACISITGAWIAENPGEVVIRWFNYRIDTSLAVLLLLAAVASVALIYALALLRGLIRIPSNLTRRRELKHYKTALTEITHSVAALAAYDIKSAEAHTRKAEKLLGQTPLTLMLSAQVARNQGDDPKTRQLLEKMLEHDETEYMAARSLSESASKQHQFPRALAMAERAYALNPKDTSSVAAIVSLHMRLGQWQEALQTLQKAGRKGTIRSADFVRYKGLIYLRQGMIQLEQGNADIALAHAHTAMKSLKYFVPAVALAARAYRQNGHHTKAMKMILVAWKFSQHPELATIFREAIASEPAARQLKLTRGLVARAPAAAESHIALAQVGIALRQWDVARAALGEAIAREPSAQAFQLMADVELGEFSDHAAAARYTEKSAAATGGALWNCRACGHIAQQWDTHCAACDAFDTIAWK